MSEKEFIIVVNELSKNLSLICVAKFKLVVSVFFTALIFFDCGVELRVEVALRYGPNPDKLGSDFLEDCSAEVMANNAHDDPTSHL